MKSISTLIKRNIKLFFKDKGMFITSLITPAILLVLYGTFLKNVFKETFVSNIPETITLSEKLINGYVGSQLISSILAVSCITVAFCCNFLMIQDKANGTIKDLLIAINCIDVDCESLERCKCKESVDDTLVAHF